MTKVFNSSGFSFCSLTMGLVEWWGWGWGSIHRTGLQRNMQTLSCSYCCKQRSISWVSYIERQKFNLCWEDVFLTKSRSFCGPSVLPGTKLMFYSDKHSRMCTTVLGRWTLVVGRHFRWEEYFVNKSRHYWASQLSPAQIILRAIGQFNSIQCSLALLDPPFLSVRK